MTEIAFNSDRLSAAGTHPAGSELAATGTGDSPRGVLGPGSALKVPGQFKELPDLQRGVVLFAVKGQVHDVPPSGAGSASRSAAEMTPACHAAAMTSPACSLSRFTLGTGGSGSGTMMPGTSVSFSPVLVT